MAFRPDPKPPKREKKKPKPLKRTELKRSTKRIRQVAEGKRVCKFNTCAKVTKNKNGICDDCFNMWKGTTPKAQKGYRGKTIRPLSDWEKAAASTFAVMSRVVRLRDTNNVGYGICIATNKRIWYFKDSEGKVVCNCDAGHFISRGTKSRMFDLNNVHAQYWRHNRDQGENKALFRENIIKKVSLQVVEEMELEQRLGNGGKPNIAYLKQLRKEFVQMEKSLLKNKNWA